MYVDQTIETSPSVDSSGVGFFMNRKGSIRYEKASYHKIFACALFPRAMEVTGGRDDGMCTCIVHQSGSMTQHVHSLAS